MSELISILLIFVLNVIFLIHAQNSDDNKTKWSSRIMENWKSSLNDDENRGQNMQTGFKDPWNIRPERNMNGYEEPLNNNWAQNMPNGLRDSWNYNAHRHTGRYLGLGPERRTGGYKKQSGNGPQERIQNGYQNSWNNNSERNEYTMDNNQAKSKPNGLTSSQPGNTSELIGSSNKKPTKSDIIKSLKTSFDNSPSVLTASASKILEHDENMPPFELLQSLKNSLLKNVLGAVAQSLRGNPGVLLSQNLTNDVKLKQRSNSLSNYKSAINNPDSSDSSPENIKASFESNSPKGVLKNLTGSLESKPPGVQKNLTNSLESRPSGSLLRNLTGLSEGSPSIRKQRNPTNSLGSSPSRGVRKNPTSLSEDSTPIRKPNEFEDLASMSSELKNTSKLPDSLINSPLKKTSTESSGSLESLSKNSSGNFRVSHQGSQSSKTENTSRKTLNSVISDFTELVMRSPGNITLETHPAGSTSNTDLSRNGSLMNIELPSGLMGLLEDSLSRNKFNAFSHLLKNSSVRNILNSLQIVTERTTNELTNLVRRNATRKLINKFTGSPIKSSANNIQSKVQTDLFERSSTEDTPSKLSNSVRRSSARKARRGSSRILKSNRGKRETSEHTGLFETSPTSMQLKN